MSQQSAEVTVSDLIHQTHHSDHRPFELEGMCLHRDASTKFIFINKYTLGTDDAQGIPSGHPMLSIPY